LKKDLHPGYISNPVPPCTNIRALLFLRHTQRIVLFEFRTWRRVNSNLRLSLHHRSSSENPGFATTAFITTTSLVNCYDLNAQVCTSICLRNNNPTLQVDDQIREIYCRTHLWSGCVQAAGGFLVLHCNLVVTNSSGLVLLSLSAIDMSSCDNMTNTSLYTVALLGCLPRVRASELGYAAGVFPQHLLENAGKVS
jgi:hypothetical protein